MKRTLQVVGIVLALVVYQHFFDRSFDRPAETAKVRKGNGVKSYEFDRLLEQGIGFDKLAKPGYYTVVVGYLDSCSICKRLEADFPEFLAARKDVLIRRVRFNEKGQIQASGPQEMADLMKRLGSYNSNHVVNNGGSYALSTCGTPHVEVYGPDGKVVATDFCSDNIDKSGLEFLRRWIKEETS